MAGTETAAGAISGIESMGETRPGERIRRFGIRPTMENGVLEMGLGRIGVLSSVVKRVDESGLSGGGFVFLILFLNFNEQHHDDCGDDVWGLQRRMWWWLLLRW